MIRKASVRRALNSSKAGAFEIVIPISLFVPPALVFRRGVEARVTLTLPASVP
jgi:hypothetical protein